MSTIMNSAQIGSRDTEGALSFGVLALCCGLLIARGASFHRLQAGL